jgi:hypothetical protein
MRRAFQNLGLTASRILSLNAAKVETGGDFASAHGSKDDLEHITNASLAMVVPLVLKLGFL